MRVIFMGNPEFAIPSLKSLLQSSHKVVGVVSNPPKPTGRGQKLHSTPVGRFSIENNIHLIEAENLNSASLHQKIMALNPDIFVVVAYRILPKTLISLPKFGAINLHASLLPKYRGAGPIQWALMNGDKKTGVTIFQINNNVDTGEILLNKEIPILSNDIMITLGTRLCTIGATLIIKALDGIQNQTIKPIKQNHNYASNAPKITKNMTLINWEWNAEKIHNWIRGLSPFPGMSTTWEGKRIRIFNTRVENKSIESEYGCIYDISHEEVFVNTGRLLLAFSEVQLEGKKRMSIHDFLLGYNFQKGDLLGL
tara:strand:- start:89 stop:1018 length:930 start_codon:yes stop_codon:yes gene_type:complete